MKKKIMALLLSTAMVGSMGALAACNTDTDAHKCGHVCPTCNKCTSDCTDDVCKDKCEGHETPEPETKKITDGYFAFSYPADGVGTIYRYLHFYEDKGLGSVVYAGAQSGTYTQAGKISYYTVTETGYEYKVWADREGAVKAHGDKATDETKAEAELTAITGTAPYTVTFKSIDDNSVIATCGYDGSYLYTGLPGADCSFMPQAGPDVYTLKIGHDTESANTVAPYNKEQAQAVVTYYKDAGHYIAINHDGTYTNSLFEDEADYITVADAYKYTYANNVFTLKDDEGKTLATIDKSGSNILYKVSGQSDVVLKEDIDPAPTTDVVLTGTHSAGNFPATLTLKTDKTATYEVVMPATYGGTQNMTGTWTNEKASITVPAAMGGGTIEITLSRTGRVWNGTSEEQVISLMADIVMKGTHSAGNFPATLTLKNGGKATYVVEMPATYGGTVTMDGTWTDEKATINVPTAMGGGTIEIALSKDGKVWTAANTDQVISLSMEVVLTGTHSAGNFKATLTLSGGKAVYVVEMPANYGGTITMDGTWTGDKVTINVPTAMGGGTIEISLEKGRSTWTAVNTSEVINLSGLVTG